MMKRVIGFMAVAVFGGVMLCSAAFSQQAAAMDAPPVSGLVPDHATLSVENLDLVQQW